MEVVRVLRLDGHGRQEHPGLVIVPLGCQLVISIAPNSHMDLGTLGLWTNAPLEKDDVFRRNVYRFVRGTDENNPEGEWQGSWTVHQSGSFDLFVEYEPLEDRTLTAFPSYIPEHPVPSQGSGGEEEHGYTEPPFSPRHAAQWDARRARHRSGEFARRRRWEHHRPIGPSASHRGPIVRFLVQPRLVITRHPFSDAERARASPSASDPDGPLWLRQPLPLEGICLQTQLTRCLGPVSDWPRSLAEPLAAGFNFLHFTPVQQLGGSGSAYSLWDQLCLHPALFRGHPEVRAAVEAAARARLEQIRDFARDHPIRRALRCDPDQLLRGEGRVSPQVALHRVLRALDPVVRMKQLHKRMKGTNDARFSDEEERWLGRVPHESVRSALTLPPDAASEPLPVVPALPFERPPGPAVRERWDPVMDDEVEATKTRVLAREIQRLEHEGGVLSMVDIVLNHTATDSPWLARHPEAACSLDNSPHLRPAWELDAALRHFSAQLAAGAFEKDGLSPKMGSLGMVNRCLEHLRHWVPRQCRPWEFYVCDVSTEEAVLGSWLLRLIDDVSPSASPAQDDDEEGEGASSLDAWVSFAASPCPPVIFDELWTAPFRDRGAELMRWMHATMTSASPDDRTAGEALPDHAMERIVTAAMEHGTVWNDGSGTRFPAHVSPDEAVLWMEDQFGTLPKDEIHPDVLEEEEEEEEAKGKRRSPAHLLPWETEEFREVSEQPPTAGSRPWMSELPALLWAARQWLADEGGGRRKGKQQKSGSKPKEWPRAAIGAVARGLSRYRRLLMAVNFALYRRYDEDWAAAFSATEGTARHVWLQEHGSKGEVEKDGPFVPRYFLRIGPRTEDPLGMGQAPTPAHRSSWTAAGAGGEGEEGEEGDDEDGEGLGARVVSFAPPPAEEYVLACNGFIWGGDPEIDFTLPKDAARSYADLVKRGPEMEFAVPVSSREEDEEEEEGGSPERAELGMPVSTPISTPRAEEGEGTDAGGDMSGFTGIDTEAARRKKGKRRIKAPPQHEASPSALIWDPLRIGTDTSAADPREIWRPRRLPRIRTPPAGVMELLSREAMEEEADEEGSFGPHEKAPGGGGAEEGKPGHPTVDTRHLRLHTYVQEPSWRGSKGDLWVRGTVVGEGSASSPHGAGGTPAVSAVTTTPWEDERPGAVATPAGREGEGEGEGEGAAVKRLLRSRRWRRLTLRGQRLHLPCNIPLPVVTASTPYMRREVVIWGDCIKLRYGLEPRDSPWLWAHMTEYVQRMARVFQGFRLDNAHGTPIHVAAAMLDAARSVRPSLYVNAELFTGDLGRDVEYVTRLGINSLVREAMQAPDEGELSHYVYRNGGTPIGSLRSANPPVGNLFPESIPAILFDCTHDNAVPAQKRSIEDALPNAAIVWGSVGAVGSVRGYDRCVPRTLSVVHEYRRYVLPTAEEVRLEGEEAAAEAKEEAGPCIADDEEEEEGKVGGGGGGEGKNGERCSLPKSFSSLSYSWVFARPLRGDRVEDEGAKSPPTPSPDDPSTPPSPTSSVDIEGGFLPLRQKLNMLHRLLAEHGYSEAHVHRERAPGGLGDVIAVHRGHPTSPYSYVIVGRTAFRPGSRGEHVHHGSDFPPVMHFGGRVVGVVLAARLDPPARPHAGGEQPREPPKGVAAARQARLQCLEGAAGRVEPVPERGSWSSHPLVITGLPASAPWATLKQAGSPRGPARGSDPLGLCEWWEDGEQDQAAAAGGSVGPVGGVHAPATLVRFHPDKFLPGSVVVFRVLAPKRPYIATEGMSFIPHEAPAVRGAPRKHERHAAARRGTSVWGPPLAELEGALQEGEGLTLVEFARLLYRADPEERDDSGGHRGVYNIPDYGPLPWAGLAGVEGVLRPIRESNDMGHPLCENLRQGPWLMDYLVDRLRGSEPLRPVAEWIRRHFTLVRQMPPGLRPQAFDHVVSAAFHCAVAAILHRMRLSPLLHRFLAPVWTRICNSTAANDTSESGGGGGDGGGGPSDVVNPLPPLHRRPSPRRLLHWVMDVNAVVVYLQKQAASAEHVTSNAHHEPPSLEEDEEKEAEEERKRRGHENRGASEEAEASLRTFLTPSSPLPTVVALALTSVQLFSHTPSAPLLAVPLLEDADVAVTPVEEGREGEEGDRPSLAPFTAGERDRWVGSTPSLAAGVPHFATGFMRNWGRDTFISLRGLLLLTGRFADAKRSILAFASVVRHGLVPNLMDGGRRPRYNARDATWFFLQAVQEYCRFAPEGDAILACRVKPRFPSDNLEDYDEGGEDGERGVPCFQFKGDPALAAPRTLGEIVCDILQRHARGIEFTEWHAGPSIDMNMKPEGFHVRIHLDRETGFIHGGNEHNCGTWMDKMGESDRFGTRGVPATPRDGAAIEITGLLYSALRWLASASESGSIPQPGVTLDEEEFWSWGDWAAKIEANFERHYWIPVDPQENARYAVEPRLINARGIYRDSLGASKAWPDYQLRPNQTIAMTVAPALFNPSHAQMALQQVERQLIGSEHHHMGIRTLDPSDWAFRGNYNNDDDSERGTAKGWNYHNGPAWLWPFGFWLRARLRFPPGGPDSWQPGDSVRWVLSRIAPHAQHLARHPTQGLPELTQADGSFCPGSCAVQAWSSACLLDALYDATECAGEERDW